jgi:spore coat protein A, manganese oxidase
MDSFSPNDHESNAFDSSISSPTGLTKRRSFIAGTLALGVSGVTGLKAQTLTTHLALSAPVAADLLAPASPLVSLPTVAPGVAPVTLPAPGTQVNLLSAAAQPKFVRSLPNPLSAINRFGPTGPGASDYTLQIKEFTSQIGLTDATGKPLTTVLWGYGTAVQLPTSPARTFTVRSGSTIQVSYVNQLLNGNGSPLPHRLQIDTTLMWANPGNLGGQAPVPLVAHRHGARAPDSASDGLPDAWSTPDANRDGTPDFRGRLYSTPYVFNNTQEAGHLWYHDHALGVTRLNVGMGLAGNYLIRDANEDYLVAHNMLPAPAYELPLMLMDRMFDATGKVYYPWSDLSIYPNAPAITHLPEFFGDFILVNGVPWPKCELEPRAYRLRLLNASDSRFYDLNFQRANGTSLGFHQVGTELGLMDAPVALTHLLLAPGERADVVVNFAGLVNQTITVTNSANTPFPNGNPVDPLTAGKIMAFKVSLPLNAAVPQSVLPAFLRPINGMLPAIRTMGVPRRKLMLFEGTDPLGRLQTMLGTVNPAPGNPANPAFGTFFYSDPVTENITAGSTEIWELHNTTVDAHPIHLHLVDFRILNREPFTGTVVDKLMGPGGASTGGYLTNVALPGPVRPAEPNEAGRKDTVITYPGEVTRILVNFPRAGEYVWHCHILSHEDHEMMRRFIVT